jgi:glycosyltransferase involved in cell wall biosynthesis
VESIIAQHAALLLARGFEVEVVAGRRGRSRIPTQVIPEIDAARPSGVLIEAELAAGMVSSRFYRMQQRILTRLNPIVDLADTVIVHNAFTLHFSLPLTAALWELAARRAPGSTIAWCHDLAWTNPLYVPAMHDGYPWDLLRRPAPNTRYVTVSAERKTELGHLWNGGEGRIRVVPNGIDVASFLRLSRAAYDLARRFRLFERDAVLLLPVRITRRKNVEVGIRVVRGLKERGLDVVFLVSGPQATHHPGLSSAYLGELKALRLELEVEEEVIFLADTLGATPNSRTVAELYSLADVLLFPSAQEGFGLPILEAGLARVPAVLSDLPIFREVGGQDTWRFDREAPADTIAAEILKALDSRPSRLYRRVLREYRWDAIVDRQIIPLLQRPTSLVDNHAVPEEGLRD